MNKDIFPLIFDQKGIEKMYFPYFSKNGFFVSLQISKQQADKQQSRGTNLRLVGT